MNGRNVFNSVCISPMVYFVYFFALFFQCIAAGVNSSVKKFDVIKDETIFNNMIGGAVFTKHKVVCALLCLENLGCDATTFDANKRTCQLHWSTMNGPILTREETGKSVFIRKGIRKPTTFAISSPQIHASFFLSPNHKMFSNYQQTGFQHPLVPDYDFAYPGAYTTANLQQNTILYYGVSYEYTLLKLLVSPDQYNQPGVLDIGIIIDKHLIDGEAVGASNETWNFLAWKCRRNDTQVCISAIHGNLLYGEQPLSDHTVGTYKNGSFIVLVDRMKGEIALFDSESGSMLFRFTNVVLSGNLISVLGIGGAIYVNVTVRLLNAYEMF